MLKFNVGAFYDATTALERLRSKIRNLEKQTGADALKEPVIDAAQIWELDTQATALQDAIDALGMRTTQISIYRFIVAVANAPTYERLRLLLDEINSRLADELGAVHMLVLEPRDYKYYVSQTPPFGVEIENKFPSLIYDVDEAAKCIALGRSTASVFHSIRCLEAGIRALSRCLGIPDPTRASGRHWGAMLTAVKDEIDRRWPSSSARRTGEREFFDNAHAGLAAMQNPWRNATMHLDQKYTEEEAIEFFGIIKSFMKRVASRCDEAGDPKVQEAAL